MGRLRWPEPRATRHRSDLPADLQCGPHRTLHATPAPTHRELWRHAVNTLLYGTFAQLAAFLRLASCRTIGRAAACIGVRRMSESVCRKSENQFCTEGALSLWSLACSRSPRPSMLICHAPASRPAMPSVS